MRRPSNGGLPDARGQWVAPGEAIVVRLRFAGPTLRHDFPRSAAKKKERLQFHEQGAGSGRDDERRFRFAHGGQQRAD
jgi:hypothetical protein